MKRTVDIELTAEEELGVLRKWAKNQPNVLKILLEHPKGYCPFPDACKNFPCSSLNCNADECNNGFAHRRS